MVIDPGQGAQNNQRSGGVQGGYVLIVDDERDIRELISRILRERGYSTLSACNGVDALSQIARHPIGLIFCNVRMPGMSGEHMYRFLAETFPAMCERIVFCSGDIFRLDEGAFFHHSGRPFLSKPFSLDDLAEMADRNVGPPLRASRDIASAITSRLACSSESKVMPAS